MHRISRGGLLAIGLLISIAGGQADDRVDPSVTGEVADAPYAPGIYCGTGGFYSLGKTPDGAPIAKATILVQARLKGSYEAHETELTYIEGRATMAEGWKYPYRCMLFKTSFEEPGLPKYVLISVEGSRMRGKEQNIATAVWDDDQKKWIGHDTVLRARKPGQVE
ncbi:MAG TPA: hypothetical protein VM452_11740 [Caulifigura sp.]|jgi:hypothetical protein|nr:hypothetical protein [Caulifigura sp.]